MKLPNGNAKSGLIPNLSVYPQSTVNIEHLTLSHASRGYADTGDNSYNELSSQIFFSSAEGGWKVNGQNTRNGETWIYLVNEQFPGIHLSLCNRSDGRSCITADHATIDGTECHYYKQTSSHGEVTIGEGVHCRNIPDNHIAKLRAKQAATEYFVFGEDR